MESEKFKSFLVFSRLVSELSVRYIVQRFKAFSHYYTYRPVPNPLNVVVVGGSFAGTQLARRLAESLPTGYRVVLVEKNSHFNYTFNFPRFSVIPGHEKKAFIPYTGIISGVPKGIFQQIQDTAVEIRGNELKLASGDSVNFEYLAIATGSKQALPSKVVSTWKENGAAELREMQEDIRKSKNIALIGGGPVGIQMATDIKSYFPQKNVTLVHSREQLLPNFGPRLHEYVLKKLNEMHVDVMLGERPMLPASRERKTSLKFKDGSTENFDLVIPCTGQTPNSTLVSSLAPGLISASKYIKVKPTLQLQSSDPSLSHIFAIGDVAATTGPKMARAATFQAEVVTSNILSLIRGRPALQEYVPHVFEGLIKLSLGKSEKVVYFMGEDGKDWLSPDKGKGDDMGAARTWTKFGAVPKDFEK